MPFQFKNRIISRYGIWCVGMLQFIELDIDRDDDAMANKWKTAFFVISSANWYTTISVLEHSFRIIKKGKSKEREI